MSRQYLCKDEDGHTLPVLAVRWTGDNFAEVEAIAGQDARFNTGVLELYFDTFDESWVPIALGDWVVVLESGDVYAEVPENFADLYWPAANGGAA